MRKLLRYLIYDRTALRFFREFRMVLKNRKP